ncbi:hypothetical protein ACX80J_02295 [Arthrobacter sp. MDB2-24]
MAPNDSAEVPLRVSFVGDSTAATNPATCIPAPIPDGTPLEPAEVAAWHQPDDDGATDYEDLSVLRAGDSGQTSSIVDGPPAGLPGFVDGGIGGGDDGGE